MLKVECESCKAPYQVDERRVPPTGLKMRCPKCGHTFLVTDPSKAAPPPPAPAIADLPAMKAPAPKKATMVGLAPKPGSAPMAPPPAGPPPMSQDLDFGDIGLPAMKPAAPKPGARPAPTAQMPMAPPPPVAVPAPAPAAAAPPQFGGLDDLDLPALAGDAGLPAMKAQPSKYGKPAAAAPAPAPVAAPAPAPPQIPASAFSFDVDLPSVPAAPMAGGGGFGSIDLPSAKARGAAPPQPVTGPLGAAPPPAYNTSSPAFMSGFGALDLPAAKAPPAPAAPAGPSFGSIDLPSAKPPAAPPGFASSPGFGSIDLPSAKPPPAPAGFASSPGFGSIDLPSAKPPPAPAGFASSPGFGSIDLPAPKPIGMQSSPGFGSIDLPSAKPTSPGFGVDLPAARPPVPSFGSIDLPQAKPGGDLPSLADGFGNLPIVQPIGASLPSARGGGGFGELDLPSIQNDLPLHGGYGGPNLPSSMGQNAHLPSAMGNQAHLPSAMGQNAHLPSAMGQNAHLPSAMGNQAHLPSAMGQNAHLPSAMGPGAHLPSAMGGNAHLPASMGDNAHLPSAMGNQAHLPSHMGNQAHLPSAMSNQAHLPSMVGDERLLPGRPGGPAPIAFGEIDLPLVGGDGGFGAPPPTHRLPDGGGGGGYGEVDLPGGENHGHGGGGGLGFGEVDLGGGNEAPPVMPPHAISAGSLAFQEASLEQSAPGGGIAAMPGRLRPQDRPAGPPSKALRIAAIAVAVVVVGGAALQLTPVGAFGHVWISDRLHASDYATDAAAKGDFARKKLALDTFANSQQAEDDLVDARKKNPRNKPLGAYAAFVEYMNQVRFGTDPARAAKVNTFISDIPADVKVNYLASAKAAQAATNGDWDKAKTLADAAIATDPKDGIQYELSMLKGEIALAQKDATGALASFNAAHVSGATPRSYFGIARAQYQAKSFLKSREAVDATLKASPTHAGALTLRAELLWKMQQDDVSAMNDLNVVLDDKNRKNLGLAELSHALTVKGWIMFARDRAGDARAAFDEAVKVDPRNVSALVGQGEVLYADSRFTEALSRFDEALNKDPRNVGATLGSAKSKVSLERLADAKTQLQAARQMAPKDMSVALWLAKVEDALGNKKAADDDYGIAISLVLPENPEAISAYSAYAKFLSKQGKLTDAQAKLEEAKAKLPDSPQLQRAFGEVADEQGQFDDAISHYEAALAKSPNDLGTRFRLGQTYLKMHKLDMASKTLDEVAAIDKEYPGLALQRGILLEESGDLQKALEQFQGALQKDPKDVDLKMRVGAAYVIIGETDKALPLLKQVYEARPNSAEVNHFLGRAYLRAGGLDAPKALGFLQRAVALDPNKAEYHLYVAWAANDSAQLGLARAEIDKSLSLDKLLADAYWQRGVLERKESQVNDAVKDLKHALDLKPSRLEAHASLAETYEDQNNNAGAMAEWQRAIAGDDKNPYWRWKYGKLLADKGQSADAAAHLQYAVENGKTLQPRPAWVTQAAFEAGEVLRKTGKKTEACTSYRFFLDNAQPGSADRKDALNAVAQLACPAEQ